MPTIPSWKTHYGKRIDGIIEGIEVVIRQEDPIGKVQAGWTLPKVTHTSAEIWLAMQIKLDLWKARQKKLAALQEFPKTAVRKIPRRSSVGRR